MVDAAAQSDAHLGISMEQTYDPVSESHQLRISALDRTQLQLQSIPLGPDLLSKVHKDLADDLLVEVPKTLARGI